MRDWNYPGYFGDDDDDYGDDDDY